MMSNAKGCFTVPEKPEPIPYAPVLQVLNVLSFISTIIFNVLNSAGILGLTNQEVSQKYPNRLEPAGWAFSIWGIIYTFNALFCVYQALPAQRGNALIFKRISVLYITVNILNSVWSVVFAQDLLWVAAGIIIAFHVSLVFMYGRGEMFYQGTETLPKNLYDFWFVEVMTSFYVGWLTVATLLNVTICIFGPTQLGLAEESYWSVLVQSVVTAIALLLVLFRQDPIFPLVVGWALIAISQKQADDALVNLSATILGCVCFGLFLVTAIYRVYRYYFAERKVLEGNNYSSAGLEGKKQPSQELNLV